MRIQPISINKSIRNFSGQTSQGTIKNNDINSSLIIEQLEKQNKTLRDGVLINGVMLLGIMISLLFFKNKTSVNKSLNFNKTATEFNSLKDKTEIPTLNTCKSINKKLKNFLQSQVDIINNVEEKEGLKAANRLLMYGPQGSGKSFFAKIYAKSIGAEYAEIRFSDYNSRWAGEDVEKLVRFLDSYLTTAKMQPNKKFMIVFNEIDSAIQPVEKFNGNNLSGHIMSKIEERSTLLTYLEKFEEETPNVILVGTTNFSPKNQGLDGAALSRFKRNIIEVELPEKDCIYEALYEKLMTNKSLKDFAINNRADLKQFAEKMEARKCSYRDLNAVFDSSLENYILNKIKQKNGKFSVKYLDDALKSIEMSDGEIYSVNNKKG